MTARCLLVSMLLLSALTNGVTADGPPPRMVADLMEVNQPELEAPPVVLVEMKGEGYFFTSDGVHGVELWRSDFTEEGTLMVRDICPGACWSNFDGNAVVFEGVLYFFADDGSRGRNLWRSDGTNPGTWLVKDVQPGRRGGVCNEGPITVDSFLLFPANNGIDGCELWRSDGTTLGTYQVAVTAPGTGYGGGPKAIRQLAGDVALFGSGDSLWITDGTPEETEPLAQVELVSNSYGPFQGSNPKVIDGVYYFLGYQDATGAEVWASDGTPEGTTILVDAYPGGSGSTNHSFLSFGGLVYFVADGPVGNSIWRTQGDPASTVPFFGPAVGDISRSPNLLRVAGGRFFFSASDPAIGQELWSSDGTEEGTDLVRDIGAGVNGMQWVWTDRTAVLDERLIFWPNDGVHGIEPWTSDGTFAGTLPLADIIPGEEGSFPIYPVSSLPRRIGNRVAFFALEADPSGWWYFWSTNGTPLGTQRIARIDDQTSSFDGLFGFRTAAIGPLDRGSVFVGQGIDGQRLWSTDGTESGTEELDPFVGDEQPRGFSLRPLPSVRDRVIFATDDQAGEKGLWSTDLEGLESQRLVQGDVGWEPMSFYQSVIASVGSTVYQTDGTVAGTRPLNGVGTVFEMAVAGGQALLSADSGPLGRELWYLSGLDEQPQFVLDIHPSGSSYPSEMAAVVVDDGILGLFFADDGDGGSLWRSDGSGQGTTKISLVDPCPDPAWVDTPTGDAKAMVWSDGLFHFCGDDGVSGPEPWVSDGSPLGTMLLVDLEPGSTGSYPGGFVTVGSSVLFSAHTEGAGRELFRSNGAAGGTQLVVDLNPGPEASRPRGLTVRDDLVYFSAYAPKHGVELHRLQVGPQSDDSINLVYDINPGPASSSPIGLALGGGVLWFGATDGVHGFELWRLDLNALFFDGFESGDTSAWGVD